LDTQLRLELAPFIDMYAHLGYAIEQVSALQTDGLKKLAMCCQGHASIMVGQSGVGKSALINGLVGHDTAEVGEVSEANRQKGRHTTTTTRLYHLPGGGALIDSPGIREFGLWHIDATEAVKGFSEFLPYLGRCQFRNCRHQTEPACALIAAAESGELSKSRLLSYQRILQEIEQG
jgi:ribosome biogenesis GTPase